MEEAAEWPHVAKIEGIYGTFVAVTNLLKEDLVVGDRVFDTRTKSA
ncbi:MAG: hypothetical protein QM589_14485 [Thermomicrobiales bacterium]